MNMRNNMLTLIERKGKTDFSENWEWDACMYGYRDLVQDSLKMDMYG